MPEPASERLQCHSATAKQYCSSSSFVARQPRASTWPDQAMVVTGIIQRHQQPALPQAIKLTMQKAAPASPCRSHRTASIARDTWFVPTTNEARQAINGSPNRQSIQVLEGPRHSL